jgi:putative transposase
MAKQIRRWTQEEREARHAAFASLPSAFQKEARRRHEAVWFFHSLSPTGSPLLERYQLAAKRADVSLPTIRRWVRSCNGLDAGDWVAALAPRRREYYQTAQASTEALDFIRSEYFSLTKPALKPIYRRALRLASERGWTIPSYTTVKRTIQAVPHFQHVLLREGQEAFDALYPAQQRDYSSLALHEMWCADGRRADVFCRWEDGTVDRPIVIAWIEVRSRVILSYLVARAESADAIRLAFKAAAEKARAIPDAVLFDSGRGFASKLLTGGTPNRFRFKVREEELLGIFPLLGIKVTWATPFAGRSKPIESFFRQFAEAERRFDGAYVGNEPAAKPESFDPAKAVSIDQYRKLLDETIAEYHQRPHRGDAMNDRSPRRVYDDLIRQTPVRQPTREQLHLCMLAAEQIRLNPRDHTVSILGNRYWSERLADLPPRTVLTARFNPESAAEPIALYDGEKFICTAALVGRTGFRDQAAAREHQRAKRTFQRARKEQAKALKDKRNAESWLQADGAEIAIAKEIGKAILPSPHIPQLVIPLQDFRTTEKKRNGISEDDLRDAIAQHFKNAAVR